MIENRVVQSALVRAMKEGSQNVEIFNKCQVTSISDGGSASSWPEVVLNNGEVLKARLLVGADGQNSKVREFAGIKTFGWDYPMWGIVATLKIDESHPNRTSWQRFLPTGPIALLPVCFQASRLNLCGEAHTLLLFSSHKTTAPSSGRLRAPLPNS